MSRRIKIHSQVDTLILVEGEDELYSLIPQIDCVFENVQLIVTGRNLRDELVGLQVATNFDNIRNIGVILDAEQSTDATIKSVQTAFQRNNLPDPTQPYQIADTHYTDLFIICQNNEMGCFEDAFLDSLAENDPKLACAKAFLACVDDPARNDRWRSKVLVHSLIAASKQPSITLGESVKSNQWDWSQPSLKAIVDFIGSVASGGQNDTT